MVPEVQQKAPTELLSGSISALLLQLSVFTFKQLGNFQHQDFNLHRGIWNFALNITAGPIFRKVSDYNILFLKSK